MRIGVVGVVLPGRWRMVDVIEFLEGFVSLFVLHQLSLVGLFVRLGILQLEHLEKKSCKEWLISMERVRNIGEDVRRSAELIIWELISAFINLDPLAEGVDCWTWVDSKKIGEGWDIGNQRVYEFIHSPSVN